MSKRSYPRVGTIHPSSRTKKEGRIKCKRCGADINPGMPFSFVDIQHNEFRGDDTVVVTCRRCGSMITPEEALKK